MRGVAGEMRAVAGEMRAVAEERSAVAGIFPMFSVQGFPCVNVRERRRVRGRLLKVP